MIQATIKFFYLASPVKPVRHGIPQLIKWLAPTNPFTKLNTDGRYCRQPSEGRGKRASMR